MLSVSQPPMTGPSTGPTITETPNRAIADPRSSTSYMSSRKPCDNGTSAAPKSPCIKRKATICSKDCDSPHRIEAMTKPAIAVSSTRLRPNRLARKPDGGVMIAAAAIWGWVVPSACITTARITQAVIAPRLATLGPRAGAAGLAMRLLVAAEPFVDEIGEAARMTSIDIDGDAHADAQRRFAFHVLDAHPHRDALDDFHPIAGGVLRRQQREDRSRGRTDAIDDAFPFEARISVDADRRRLARPDIGQLGFLGTRLDPQFRAGDEAERLLRGLEIGADLNGVDIGDDAVERRAHDRVVEIALRIVDAGFRLQIERIGLDRLIGVAAELGERGIGLRLGDRDALFGGIKGVLGLVVSRFRSGAGRHQILLPLEIGLIEGEIGLSLLDLRERELVARLKRQNLIVERD